MEFIRLNDCLALFDDGAPAEEERAFRLASADGSESKGVSGAMQAQDPAPARWKVATRIDRGWYIALKKDT